MHKKLAYVVALWSIFTIQAIAQEITLKFLESKPKGLARDFYIWRFLSDENTSLQDALKAYELVYRKTPKLTALLEKKGMPHELPRELHCKNLSFESLLKEDQETYPTVIRKLRDKYAQIFMSENLDEVIKQRSDSKKVKSDKTKSDISESYDENAQKFIRYVLKSDARDLKFTEYSVKMALRQSIREELDIARDHVLNQKLYKDKEELGLDYTNKNARIKSYISYYMEQLNKGSMIGYNEESRQADIEKIYSRIIHSGVFKYGKDMKTRLADVMAGKYIASLNDSEFMKLLQDEQLVSPEQVQSLTRKYRDIENLQDEVYIQSNWKSIAKAQEKSTEIQGEIE